MTEEKNWLGEWSFEVEGLGELDFIGSFTYSPGGKFALEVSMKQASFDVPFYLQKVNKIKYIVGLDYKSSKNLTLVDSFVGASKWSFNGGNFITITPALLIEGLYCDNDTSLLFDSQSVNYSGLNQWLRKLNEVNTSIDNESDTLTLTYKRSESINFQIDENLDLSILFDYSTKQVNSDKTGFFLTENVRTIFKSSKGPIDIELFSQYGEHLRRLLQILYYQPCFVLGSTIDKADTNEKFPIYYSQDNDLIEYTMHKGYLCHYRDINNFTHILIKWFELRKSDDYTYITWVASKHLFINTPFSEEVFLENVRSLEVYHKARYPKSIGQQEKNTYLKDRIRYLLDVLKGFVALQEYNNFIINEGDFISVLVENRHYLTHYGENTTTSKNLLTVPQLYSYSSKARIILLTLLLNDIGIEANKTFGNLKERHNY